MKSLRRTIEFQILRCGDAGYIIDHLELVGSTKEKAELIDCLQLEGSSLQEVVRKLPLLEEVSVSLNERRVTDLILRSGGCRAPSVFPGCVVHHRSCNRLGLNEGAGLGLPQVHVALRAVRHIEPLHSAPFHLRKEVRR